MKFTARYPAVLGTAIVAGLFAALVGFLLTVDFLARGEFELFDSPEYLALKEELQENPGDAALHQSIRDLDRRLRANYFSRRAFMATGIFMLLGGVVIALVMARWAAALRPKLPDPRPLDAGVDPELNDQQFGRWASVAVVSLLLLTICIVAARSQRILPESLAELQAGDPASQSGEVGLASETTSIDPTAAGKGGAIQPTLKKGTETPRDVELPSRAAYAAAWPRFRGPTGSGICLFSDVPDKWDGRAGEGLVWKVAVPLPGFNSPVVWNDRVFVSGATLDEQAVFCFDTQDGRLRWRQDVPPTDFGEKEFEVMESTGYAASTTATDGVRVYAIFATADVVAVDYDGNQLWRKNLGLPDNPYGHASSLATYQDLLIIQLDQGTEDDDKSKLIALRGATGRVAWEVTRKVASSWATPIVIAHEGRDELITCVAPWVIAYAPEDGRELWRAECLGGEVGPSPVCVDGVVYASNESGGMFAIRVGGNGNVTDTHILWFTDIDVPDVCSPLISKKFVLLLAHGLLACFDRQDDKPVDDLEEPREPLWEEDFEEITSSPSLVGNLVYMFSEEGKAWIIEPTEQECKRIAEFEMGEPCRSSPAFQPGRIYIRGDDHLFCIGAK